MSRPTLLAALISLALGAAAIGIYLHYQEVAEEEERDERRARREAEAAAEAEERDEYVEELRARSSDAFPTPLENLALGITEAELRERRPEAGPRTRRAPAGAGRWLEERLGNGAEVLYGFQENGDALAQVQVLSMVPPEGIPPHLRALVQRYETPTGIWHCPAQSAAGVPTRRFTWQLGEVSIQDVILIHPGGVSLTLYIAPTAVIGESLRVARCRPVQSREEMADLPVATPEQLRQPLEDAR